MASLLMIRRASPPCSVVQPKRRRGAPGTRNRGLLLSLLNAVLRPVRPVVSADVVNPKIQTCGASDRALVLDIPSVHDDGIRNEVDHTERPRVVRAARVQSFVNVAPIPAPERVRATGVTNPTPGPLPAQSRPSLRARRDTRWWRLSPRS